MSNLTSAFTLTSVASIWNLFQNDTTIMFIIFLLFLKYFMEIFLWNKCTPLVYLLIWIGGWGPVNINIIPDSINVYIYSNYSKTDFNMRLIKMDIWNCTYEYSLWGCFLRKDIHSEMSLGRWHTPDVGLCYTFWFPPHTHPRLVNRYYRSILACIDNFR